MIIDTSHKLFLTYLRQHSIMYAFNEFAQKDSNDMTIQVVAHKTENWTLKFPVIFS